MARQRIVRSYDAPITPDEADRLARTIGYRLVSCGPSAAVTHDRFLAIFQPEPDDGKTAYMADGRTLRRALWRGLAMCDALASVTGKEPA